MANQSVSLPAAYRIRRKPKLRPRRMVERAAVWLLLLAGALVVLLPFFYMIASSLETNAQIGALTPQFIPRTLRVGQLPAGVGTVTGGAILLQQYFRGAGDHRRPGDHRVSRRVRVRAPALSRPERTLHDLSGHADYSIPGHADSQLCADSLPGLAQHLSGPDCAVHFQRVQHVPAPPVLSHLAGGP